MIDLSDGVSSDLQHLCAASKVGARIYTDKIPLAKNILKIAETNQAALEFALDGGEDFELLFTADKKNCDEIFNRFPAVSHIGEITQNIEKIELECNFQTIILQLKGFQHFR